MMERKQKLQYCILLAIDFRNLRSHSHVAGVNKCQNQFTKSDSPR